MKLTQLNKPNNVIRRNSNQKIKTLATKELAGETEKMSKKLEALKQQFELEKNTRKQLEKPQISQNSDTGSRWRPSSGSSKVSIQNIKVQKRPSVERKTFSREGSIKNRSRLVNEDKLAQFLTSIQMQDYIEIFQQNGFDDQSLLFDLKSEYLDQMKIPKGHQIRLLKKIREKQIQDEEKYSEEESCYVALDDLVEDVQFEPNTNALKGNLQNKQKVLIDSSSMTQQSKIKKKNVSFKVENDCQKHDLIKELQQLAKYLHFNDEKEGWRNKAHQEEQDDKANQEINQELSTQTETITQPHMKSNLPLEVPINIDVRNNKNKSCWQCFKVIIKDQIKFKQKYLCSQSCQDKYLEENNISCSNNQCTSTIFKGEGLFLNCYWFCTEECMKIYDYELMKTQKYQLDKYFKINSQNEQTLIEENNPLELTDEKIDLNFDNIKFNE